VQRQIAPSPERSGSRTRWSEKRDLGRTEAFFDAFAADEPRWRRRNRTYYRLIESLVRFVVPPGASVLELGCGTGELLEALEPSRGVGVDVSGRTVEAARARAAELEFVHDAAETFVRDERFDYVVCSDLAQFADDLLAILRNVSMMTHERSRVVVHSYSQLWRPLIRVAELLRLKPRKPIRNWVSPDDVVNLLQLSGFEVVTISRRILFPKKVPLLSSFLNGVVANLWLLQHLCLTYWVVARPVPRARRERSVSVVIPCRNEAGTIAAAIERVPDLGASTELVFVEGGSTDGTRDEIERQIELHPERRLVLAVQQGRGKADAVRLGFEVATGEVLMVLDGDLTVAPEDLTKFYDAIAEGRAELVNGSRLVYGLDPGAMRFLNVLGNKLFSLVFSSLIGQHVKDTLCGTKVLLASDYRAIARGRAYFGEVDPFGDFDLLLGAAKLGLRIVDLPVRYEPRQYGRTNISRFRHGWLLARMTAVAFVKLKLRPVQV
jgi:SAM-dependent methyltransferase